MVTENQPIFALDIGTRSVVGLLVEPDGSKFKVVGYEREEHAERSMLDGQIHDVVAVADVIARIKQRLEEKTGQPLTHVAVAAAGRSLHTQRIEVAHDISGISQLNENDILTLELTAVQQAQRSLANQQESQDFTQYYCVGYSVVNYFLDNEIIGNLMDQRGKEARVEIIATFLPRMVVDSLIAALKRVHLEMLALTLEPIAAINVLVPSTMRRLNVALVDIGAGTSDIAITGEGTISAYGMVPSAGDEITDALSQAYLLDFTVAETVKRELSEQTHVSFTDILGMESRCTREEIIEKIEPDIDKLAELICCRILELNGKAPQAVMLIGGGSLTPELARKVAEKLDLPTARVAVRGAEAIQSFTDKQELTGPEFVTPLGIAVAARKHPIKYLSIHLNDEALRIFDLKEMNVGEVLLYAGVDIKRLHGRPGLAMTVHVNGKMKIIPGTHGTPPVLSLNGQPAQLDTLVKTDDRLTLEIGRDGNAASATPASLFDEIDTLDITINGTPYSLPPSIKVNGKQTGWNVELRDRDEVEFSMPKTCRDALIAAELYVPEMAIDTLPYTVNGKAFTYPYSLYSFKINGREASLTDRISKNDAITFEKNNAPFPTIQEILPVEELTDLSTTVTFNGETLRIPSSEMEILMDGERAELTDPLHKNATIVIQIHFKRAAIFSDAFRYIDDSLQAPADGKKLILSINGNAASFQDPIKTGDALELRWE
ncbi:cell division protein FtsA [Aneurinibacillus terranovensis]|uniref:cell division protein FtsA n=1 Tax=Aneurinibacillus terranovensis TaxID=278991 RepID=UPI0003FE5568|nr:cell division protein FtsA [Aneurinibacillus terranovensis]